MPHHVVDSLMWIAPFLGTVAEDRRVKGMKQDLIRYAIAFIVPTLIGGFAAFVTLQVHVGNTDTHMGYQEKVDAFVLRTEYNAHTTSDGQMHQEILTELREIRKAVK